MLFYSQPKACRCQPASVLQASSTGSGPVLPTRPHQLAASCFETSNSSDWEQCTLPSTPLGLKHPPYLPQHFSFQRISLLARPRACWTLASYRSNKCKAGLHLAARVLVSWSDVTRLGALASSDITVRCLCAHLSHTGSTLLMETTTLFRNVFVQRSNFLKIGLRGLCFTLPLQPGK